jgi:hypothetical protein
MPQSARPALIIKSESDAYSIETDSGIADGLTVQALRRTRIWEFGTNLHCSIIGTCLSTAELRHVLGKVGTPGASTASDHELHRMGVVLAGRREGGARLLQKALDRRHRSAINRSSKIKEPAGLLAHWQESLKQGEIPGAYWAVLTHPLTTEEIVKEVFGDVHMLSHLVGAANRADIRRLRQLEAENAALAAKVDRQQSQLHEGFSTRDRTIRHLNDLLARRPSEHSEQAPSLEGRDETQTVGALLDDINRRLGREKERRERSDLRASAISTSLQEKERMLAASQHECTSLRQELDLIERELSALSRPEALDHDRLIDLSGATLLYVGGRTNQIPQLKDMAERTGARFLHHDGGMEHSPSLNPGLVSRADCIFFPIDCISHEAVVTIKRLCRQTGKTYQPLRTGSLACLLSGLAKMSGYRAEAAAE